MKLFIHNNQSEPISICLEPEGNVVNCPVGLDCEITFPSDDSASLEVCFLVEERSITVDAMCFKEVIVDRKKSQ